MHTLYVYTDSGVYLIRDRRSSEVSFLGWSEWPRAPCPVLGVLKVLLRLCLVALLTFTCSRGVKVPPFEIVSFLIGHGMLGGKYIHNMRWLLLTER